MHEHCLFYQISGSQIVELTKPTILSAKCSCRTVFKMSAVTIVSNDLNSFNYKLLLGPF